MSDQMSAEIQRKLDTPVEDAPLTFKLIESISNTEMVPAAYRGRPQAIVAAVLAGREMNLPPFEAMRSIDIIDGKPNLASELIQRRILEAGHKVKTVEATPERVTLRGARTGAPDFDPEWDVEEVTYTWEEASRVVVKWKMEQGKNGKWFPAKDRDGNKIPLSYLTDKENWRNYPTDMLYWRCLTRLARRLFPDAIGATKVTYTAEELAPNLSDYTPPPRPEPGPVDWETGEVLTSDDDLVVEDDFDDEIVDAEVVEDGDDETPQNHDVFDAPVEADPGSVDPEQDEGPSRGESDVPADDPFDMTGANPANPADRAAAQAPFQVEATDDELDVAWSTIYRIVAEADKITAGNMDTVRNRVRDMYAAMGTVGLWPATGSGTALELALLKHHGTRHVSELRRDQLDGFAVMSVEAAARKVGDHGRQDVMPV